MPVIAEETVALNVGRRDITVLARTDAQGDARRGETKVGAELPLGSLRDLVQDGRDCL